MGRRCQAFVGHFGSAISHMMYNAMCHQYDTHTATCPPAVNIGEMFSFYAK